MLELQPLWTLSTT